MTIRVVQSIGNATDRQMFAAALHAWRSPGVTSVILHRPGAWLHQDGREQVIDAETFVPGPAEPEPAGAFR